MCYVLKYGIWNVKEPKMEQVNALVSSGYSPLTAMVLASRGMDCPQTADAFLSCQQTLSDPYSMRDMAAAAQRVRQAVANKKFHIWTATTIEEGFALLTGLTPAQADKKITEALSPYNYLAKK